MNTKKLAEALRSGSLTVLHAGLKLRDLQGALLDAAAACEEEAPEEPCAHGIHFANCRTCSPPAAPEERYHPCPFPHNGECGDACFSWTRTTGGTPRCPSIFMDHRCAEPEGHAGAHASSRDAVVSELMWPNPPAAASAAPSGREERCYSRGGFPVLQCIRDQGHSGDHIWPIKSAPSPEQAQETDWPDLNKTPPEQARRTWTLRGCKENEGYILSGSDITKGEEVVVVQLRPGERIVSRGGTHAPPRAPLEGAGT